MMAIAIQMSTGRSFLDWTKVLGLIVFGVGTGLGLIFLGVITYAHYYTSKLSQPDSLNYIAPSIPRGLNYIETLIAAVLLWFSGLAVALFTIYARGLELIQFELKATSLSAPERVRSSLFDPTPSLQMVRVIIDDLGKAASDRPDIVRKLELLRVQCDNVSRATLLQALFFAILSAVVGFFLGLIK